MKFRGLGCLLGALLLCGCASMGENPADPWEGVNRKVFAFNDGLDRYAAKPVAQTYQTITPLPTRTGLSNFFGNIEDLWTGANNLMQGKPKEGLLDFGRVAINTTIGMFGLFDLATEFGIEKHDEDFGQTLGRWGVPDGPYMVLPLFGPSSVRDTGGLIVDKFVFYPDQLIDSVPLRNSGYAMKFVSKRAQLLGAETTLDEAALDKYVFLRNFYLQRRRSLVFDGNPPREKDDF